MGKVDGPGFGRYDLGIALLLLIVAILCGTITGHMLSRMVHGDRNLESVMGHGQFVLRYLFCAGVFLMLISPDLLRIMVDESGRTSFQSGELQMGLLKTVGALGPLKVVIALMAVVAAMAGFASVIGRRPTLGTVLLLMTVIGIIVPLLLQRIPSRYVLTPLLGCCVGIFLFIDWKFHHKKRFQTVLILLLVALSGLTNLRGSYVYTKDAEWIMKMMPLVEEDAHIYITPWSAKIIFDYYDIKATSSKQLKKKRGLFRLDGTGDRISYLFAQTVRNRSQKKQFRAFLHSLSKQYHAGLTEASIDRHINSSEYLMFRFSRDSVNVFQFPLGKGDIGGR
ncbi:MAG: hypothetical protein JRK53_25800 [Deltaproteobacteria bacterium]|nr:hypothetical protein [Deltaproteobacteria bacterium]